MPTHKNIQHSSDVVRILSSSLLSGRTQLPAEKTVCGHTQHDENRNQCRNVQREIRIEHVQLLQCRQRRLEMAVRLVALEFLATECIRGQRGALETVPDVRQIRDPAQIDWYRVEADEKAAEQQERHGHHRRQENAVLHVHRSADNQTDGLRNERDQQTGAQKHRVSVQLHRLRREVVDDRHVDDTEDCLAKRIWWNG